MCLCYEQLKGGSKFSGPAANQEKVAVDEFSLYESFESPEHTQSFDVFGWWKTAPNALRRLRYFAVRYLTVPASSVASEEVFSAAGRTMTHLRANLAADTASTLLMIRCNRWYAPLLYLVFH